MGDLILCNYPIAAMPFYVEAFSGNIYSLEELCYYIEHNLFLLEEEFFEEELFCWIENEVGAKDLAERLRLSVQGKKGLSEILILLWKETGYWDTKTAGELVTQIKGLSEMSVLERKKLRADRYAENKRYFLAILEYRKLLQMEEVCRKNSEVCGNIWHNQGVCFAGLFLYNEAKECFLTAYKYHRNIESVYQALAACRYLKDEEAELSIRNQYGISDSTYVELTKQWQEALESKEILEFNEQLEELFENDWQTLLEQQELLPLLADWQREYQKNCR